MSISASHSITSSPRLNSPGGSSSSPLTSLSSVQPALTSTLLTAALPATLSSLSALSTPSTPSATPASALKKRTRRSSSAVCIKGSIYEQALNYKSSLDSSAATCSSSQSPILPEEPNTPQDDCNAVALVSGARRMSGYLPPRRASSYNASLRRASMNNFSYLATDSRSSSHSRSVSLHSGMNASPAGNLPGANSNISSSIRQCTFLADTYFNNPQKYLVTTCQKFKEPSKSDEHARERREGDMLLSFDENIETQFNQFQIATTNEYFTEEATGQPTLEGQGASQGQSCVDFTSRLNQEPQSTTSRLNQEPESTTTSQCDTASQSNISLTGPSDTTRTHWWYHIPKTTNHVPMMLAAKWLLDLNAQSKS